MFHVITLYLSTSHFSTLRIVSSYNYITFQYVVLQYIAIKQISLHFIAFNYIVVCNNTFYFWCLFVRIDPCSGLGCWVLIHDPRCTRRPSANGPDDLTVTTPCIRQRLWYHLWWCPHQLVW